MLFPCMLCAALLMCLFVLCVACLTVFVNCLVKQFAICLGVVAILLLNVMDVFSVCGGALMDIPCMVFQRVCVLWIQCDRHARPHDFRVADKVFIKYQRLKENEDSKLRQHYRRIYTINSFLSPSNVILTDENGRLDNAQSEEDNSSRSDRSEYEDKIPQHSENNVNHKVVNSNQNQDNGDMNHEVEDSTHQQPLSVK